MRKILHLQTARIARLQRYRARRRARKVRNTIDFPSPTPAQRQVTRVTLWDGGDPEEALCLSRPIDPPNPWCFNANREESIKVFANIRRDFETAIRRKWPFVNRRSPERRPRISTYLDLSKLETISTAAAVVLASEYERISNLQDSIPPTVDLHRWRDPVFKKLYEIGFFEIVGLADTGRALVEGSGSTRTMRIVSSKTVDDLEVIDKALQELALFLRPAQAIATQVDEMIIQFVTAISEAISNVTNHAYPEDAQLAYRHINRVWVAATADREDDSLTIVVYDQGVSIPATYPRMQRLEKVTRFLSRAIRPKHDEGPYVHDGTYIRAALRYGGSRTDKEYRGKGLPQMYEALSRMKRGTMTIVSRGGWCERHATDTRIRSGYVDFSIGGTLLEWRVALP